MRVVCFNLDWRSLYSMELRTGLKSLITVLFLCFLTGGVYCVLATLTLRPSNSTLPLSTVGYVNQIAFYILDITRPYKRKGEKVMRADADSLEHGLEARHLLVICP